MIDRRRRFLLAALLPALAAAQTAGLEGIWHGELRPGAVTLRLVLKVTKAAGGSLTARLDSIDQGARDLPLEAVSLENGAVHFELRVAGGVFDGKLNSAATEIAGTWKQGPGTLPLTFQRIEKEPEPRRPQMPKPPFPYDIEEVGYENKPAPGVKLAGTLTLPRGNGKWPAALLITGSGPQDRDESLMGHKPFWVLADHLTRKGIAVLRVDDRGVAKSTGDFAAATSEDFAFDALAGIEFLKAHPRVDAKGIGLIGHSEGGVIAPMAAVKSLGVAFLVLMAATAVTGDQVLLEQSARVIRAAGGTELGVEKNREAQLKIFEIVRQEADPAIRLEKLQDAVKAAGGPEGQARMAASPWFRFFLDYDPAKTLAKVKCPVLAINGARDTQVSTRQNLPVIEKTLKAAGNADVTAIEFPRLNHLFQTSITGAPAEYGSIEETMAPVVLDTISAWILARAK